MKRLFLFLIPILTFSLLFTRCTKEETYSCDEEVDTWVKQNKTEVSQWSLQKIQASNLTVQQAVFRASSPQKRYSLWLEKISAVQLMDWNEQELQHIRQLKGMLSAELFTSDQKKAETIIKLNAWKAYAMNELKWEASTVTAIAGTLAMPVSIAKRESGPQQLQLTATTMMLADSACTCNKYSDFCNGGIAGPNGPLRCGASNCNTKSVGCGWLWLEECDGRCG